VHGHTWRCLSIRLAIIVMTINSKLLIVKIRHKDIIPVFVGLLLNWLGCIMHLSFRALME